MPDLRCCRHAHLCLGPCWAWRVAEVRVGTGGWEDLAQGRGKQAAENPGWGKQEAGYMSPLPGAPLHLQAQGQR